MASLDLSHIYKVYPGGVKAVSDFSMKINNKEFIVFVGPSGCGKSTTLRMIAGLEEITAGELRIGDKIVNDMQPKERNIAMVFQNYALYPHMTVYENIAYGLKIAKTPKDEIKKKVMNAAELLGIEEYLFRKPKALSGGQRQRVALGRAIVRNPKVFLLDEPLSNLDAKLRGTMRTEITKLHQRLQTTFIYVTHDQVEAMTMGTRIVVMKKGFIQQVDTPRNIFNYPVNKFVAGFIGTPQMNFYNFTMEKKGNSVNCDLEIGLKFKADYSLLDHISTSYMNNQHRCVLGIRPDNVALIKEGEKIGHDQVAFEAKVNITEALGSETIVYATLDTPEDIGTNDNQIIVKTLDDVNIKVGDIIKVALCLNKVHVFDFDTEESIKDRVPSSSAIEVKVEKGIAKFGAYSYKFAPAIVKNIKDGKAIINIPSFAIQIGEGNLNAKVRSTTLVGEYTLYDLELDGNILFALSKVKDSGIKEINIDFNQPFLTIEQKDNIVKSLDQKMVLHGNLVRNKEEGNYNYLINGFNVPITEEKCQKLFNAKGKKILKTALDFETSCFSIDLEKNEFTGTIDEIIDYGNVKLAKITLGEDTILAVVKNHKLGDSLSFGLDLTKTRVMDHNLKIMLA